MTVTGALIILVGALILYAVDQWFEKSKSYARLEIKIHHLRDFAAGVLAVSTAILRFSF